MASRRNWGGLPVEILIDIFKRIHCVLDRIAVHHVCDPWRQALADTPAPPPHRLPLLLVPASDGPKLACVLSGGAVRWNEVVIPEPETPGRDARCRYFGSYEGGWLFRAVNQTSAHILTNVYDNLRSINVPNVILGLEVRDLTHGLDLVVAPPQAAAQPLDMVILAVALSSAPETPGCVGAGIIACPSYFGSARCTTFWEMGDFEAQVALELTWHGDAMVFEDVIFCGDTFNFLTREEQVWVSLPDVTQDYVHLNLIPGPGHNLHVRARYLVESRHELLMVVRFFDQPGPACTSTFKVFHMIEAGHAGQENTELAWSELPTLDGRLLFLAPGCSRSYEADVYPGLGAGIYFLDDHSFFSVATMTADEDDRVYSSFDNGRWSLDSVAHISSAMPPVSRYSPPVWFLH